MSRPLSSQRQSRIRHLALRYNLSTIGYVLRVFGPLGVLFSALGLIGTAAALWFTWVDMSDERDARIAERQAWELERRAREEERAARADERETGRALLLSLAYERLEAARSADQHNTEVYKRIARAGQIPILEQLVLLGMDLENIDASSVNLVVGGSRDPSPRGIDLGGAYLSKANLSFSNLAGANLSEAILSGSNLSSARLRRALLMESNLTDAILTNADLSCTDLAGAVLRGATLKDTNLTSANLRGVKNLTQRRLDMACAVAGFPPENLPNGLTWSGAECRSVESAIRGVSLDIYSRWPESWRSSPCLKFAVLSGFAEVIDGDTISLHGTPIRLDGIDAPESKQLCTLGGEDWACGKDAALALEQQVEGKRVSRTEKSVDRYGRILGVCRVSDGELNAWLVSQGWALSYGGFSEEYLDEQSSSEMAGVGLWRGEFEAPWIWRQNQRR